MRSNPNSLRVRDRRRGHPPRERRCHPRRVPVGLSVCPPHRRQAQARQGLLRGRHQPLTASAAHVHERRRVGTVGAGFGRATTRERRIGPVHGRATEPRRVLRRRGPGRHRTDERTDRVIVESCGKVLCAPSNHGTSITADRSVQLAAAAWKPSSPMTSGLSSEIAIIVAKSSESTLAYTRRCMPTRVVQRGHAHFKLLVRSPEHPPRHSSSSFLHCTWSSKHIETSNASEWTERERSPNTRCFALTQV